MKAFKSNVSTMFSGTFVSILFSLLPSALLAYGYAAWIDIEHHDWGRLLADALFPPLGIIHGLILLLMN